MFLALVFLCSLTRTKVLVGNGAYGFFTNWCLLEFMAWLFSCITRDGETDYLVICYKAQFYHVFFNIFVPCIMIHDCHLFVAAKPAYYNYICAMLLLNGLSLFGCLLVASGAGFGLWYVKNIIFKIYANLFPCKKSVWGSFIFGRLYNLTTVCYHSLYLPLLYVTFLADFFQVHLAYELVP
jgi:hypothetical protein